MRYRTLPQGPKSLRANEPLTNHVLKASTSPLPPPLSPPSPENADATVHLRRDALYPPTNYYGGSRRCPAAHSISRAVFVSPLLSLLAPLVFARNPDIIHSNIERFRNWSPGGLSALVFVKYALVSARESRRAWRTYHPHINEHQHLLACSLFVWHWVRCWTGLCSDGGHRA